MIPLGRTRSEPAPGRSGHGGRGRAADHHAGCRRPLPARRIRAGSGRGTRMVVGGSDPNLHAQSSQLSEFQLSCTRADVVRVKGVQNRPPGRGGRPGGGARAAPLAVPAPACSLPIPRPGPPGRLGPPRGRGASPSKPPTASALAGWFVPAPPGGPGRPGAAAGGAGVQRQRRGPLNAAPSAAALFRMRAGGTTVRLPGAGGTRAIHGGRGLAANTQQHWVPGGTARNR